MIRVAQGEAYCADGNTTTEEARANAHLIAAAPELYEALMEAKEIIRIMHGDLAWGIYDQHSPEMKRINNALAKAEGRK